MLEVSIVIVCMNNLKNLYPCLDSIKKYTTISYECFVVAYLFSKENLEKVKKDFPWVKFIESNEIRGFSENNNLALRQTKGKYCFVMNDDTEMKMPVVDRLVESFSQCPENTAIVSPNILNYKGEVSVCGRNPLDWKISFISEWYDGCRYKPSRYINQKGLFQTYNILGAAFLIKTDLFSKIGWFDERYFFCPEDIAVSTTLNKMGYLCYVDTDVEIYHYEGMSGKSSSKMLTATKPAAMLGSLLFYSDNSLFKRILLETNLLISLPCHIVYHSLMTLINRNAEANKMLAIGELNCFKALFMFYSPKEAFIYFYKKLKNSK